MQPSVWTVMGALLVVHFAGMGTFVAVPVLAPQIAAELGIPAALAGVHTSLAYGGALASVSLSQGLVARWGGIRTIQVGLLTIGVGIALAALGHPAALVASAVLAGFGHGPMTPAGSHLLHARTPPGRRGLVFSLKQTGVPLGAMLIAAVAPAVASLAGWRAGLLTVTLLCILVAAGLQYWRGALDADRRPGTRVGWAGATQSLGLLRTERELRLLALAGGAFGIGQFCFIAFFVVQQVEALGIDPVRAGLNLAAGQAAAVVARVGWGVVADRVGPRIVLTGIGLGIGVACAMLAAATPSWPNALLILAGMAMGATAIGWNGVLLSEAARVAPTGQVGGATAALSFVFGLVLMAGPSIFSLLVGLTGGYAAGFLGCGLAGLAGALCCHRLARA